MRLVVKDMRFSGFLTAQGRATGRCQPDEQSTCTCSMLKMEILSSSHTDSYDPSKLPASGHAAAIGSNPHVRSSSFPPERPRPSSRETLGLKRISARAPTAVADVPPLCFSLCEKWPMVMVQIEERASWPWAGS